MQKITLSLILVLAVTTALCKSRTVANESEFKAAISVSQPGDHLIIKNGTYSPWTSLINLQGTSSKPITIEAESTGKVIFMGDSDTPLFRVTGAYIILKGISFTLCKIVKGASTTGVLVEFESTDNCRLTECVFSENPVADINRYLGIGTFRNRFSFCARGTVRNLE